MEVKTESLHSRYRNVLTGFERYSFTEQQLQAAEGDFESALHDQQTCLNCDGNYCRTTVNHDCKNPYWHKIEKQAPCGPGCYLDSFQGYYALEHASCKAQNNPAFAVNPCPGPQIRKTEIIDSRTTKEQWWEK